MKVEVTLTGKDELSAAFATVEAASADLNKIGAWTDVANEFRKIEKEVFASEGGSGESGKWKELSPVYAVQKQKKYGSVLILQASGKMYRSLAIRGAADSVYEAGPQELTLGSSVSYAGYHQKGGGRLPQRKMVDMTQDHLSRLGKPITAKLRQVAANAKLLDRRGF